MRQLAHIALLGIALALPSTYASGQDCEWCGMQDAPDSLSWTTRIAPPTEPGDRLVVTGTVFQRDGRSPAENVRIYVYHTNSRGMYPKRGDERGNARRHGYLRGWMQTDAMGRYRFETIRPAPYRTHGGEPAHIHYTIEAPGGDEYWLNGAWFADDPRVTEQLVSGLERQGGFSSVMNVVRDDSGIWRGQRNIILKTYD